MNPEIISILVVAVIVTVYLYREHRKSGRYFGNSDYLTRNEKQQLETYKKIYSPIAENFDFPSISENGYEFEDVALSAQKIPYNPPIPKPSDLLKLKAGQEVKIVIVEKDGDSQRVWVQILDVKYPLFEGKLLNSPYDIEELNEEVEIRFHSNHILQI